MKKFIVLLLLLTLILTGCSTKTEVPLSVITTNPTEDITTEELIVDPTVSDDLVLDLDIPFGSADYGFIYLPAEEIIQVSLDETVSIEEQNILAWTNENNDWFVALTVYDFSLDELVEEIKKAMPNVELVDFQSESKIEYPSYFIINKESDSVVFLAQRPDGYTSFLSVDVYNTNYIQLLSKVTSQFMQVMDYAYSNEE